MTRDFGIGERQAGIPFHPQDHLLSIQTSNSVGSAAGSFTITLAYKKLAGDTEPWYYKVINPLDMVEISLNGSTTTMMGIVDRVKKSTRITGSAGKRVVTIIGRSLGAIWEFDLIKYFPNALKLDAELNRSNVALQQGEIQLGFMNKPIYEAILKIYRLLPALKITVGKNGNENLEKFIDVGSELWVRSDEKLFNSQLSPYSGSIWDYFKQYVITDFNELWTDSKDGKLYLRSRPKPFSVLDPENVINAVGGSGQIGWNTITNWMDPNKSYHRVREADITREDLNIDHSSGFSVFSVLAGDRFAGGQAVEYATFPPLIDQDLVHEIGMREYPARVPYIPINSDSTVNDGTLAKFKFYRDKLYFWNRDNHRMEYGTIGIRGEADIRAGDKILTDNGMMYYVPSVSNNYEYGKSFTTNLTVEKGMDRDTRDKLYKAGMDFVK
jgi:hypothetical protein